MVQNPVGWFEIYVQDMARAKAFYEGLFDIELQKLDVDIDMLAFPMQPDQPGASGALVCMPGCCSGGNSTLVYFSCSNCGESEARAAQLGGTIHRSRMDIGPYGFISLILDTEGNLFGLHSMQ